MSYTRTKEETSGNNRRYRENNRLKCALVNKEYRIKNKEKLKAKKKIWYEKNKKKIAKAYVIYKQNNPDVLKVGHVLRYAIKIGKIKRPDECSSCGVHCVPVGHHPDYSKLLGVVWLCRSCHRILHFRKRGKTLL